MQRLKMPEVLRLARLAAQVTEKDWAPHLRDDQALQLAVKLGMTVEVDTRITAYESIALGMLQYI